MIRSGDDDRIINPRPSGIHSKFRFITGAANNACFHMEEGLLFGGLYPPNRKGIPLRPPSLCGEISILEKSGIS